MLWEIQLLQKARVRCDLIIYSEFKPGSGLCSLKGINLLNVTGRCSGWLVTTPSCDIVWCYVHGQLSLLSRANRIIRLGEILCLAWKKVAVPQKCSLMQLYPLWVPEGEEGKLLFSVWLPWQRTMWSVVSKFVFDMVIGRHLCSTMQSTDYSKHFTTHPFTRAFIHWCQMLPWSLVHQSLLT